MSYRRIKTVSLVCLAILLVLAAYIASRQPKGHWEVSEKWKRWNESYSPEADEPEPPKHIFVPEPSE